MNFFSLFKRKLLYKLKKKRNIDLEIFNESSLDELFNIYGSDKADFLKIYNKKGHGFSDFYVKNLKHLKEKKIKILEVGSYSGSSAAAFSKYFNNSVVYCFDINISNFKYSSKKIQVYGLDINNENKIKGILEKINIESNSQYFDIIIDDGSHYLGDILFSLKTLYKYLIKDGFYIIEDYKHPNYYKYNRDIDHIYIDKTLKFLEDKKLFTSSVLNNDDQIYLHKNIKKIKTYRGNLEDSDICFIEKV